MSYVVPDYDLEVTNGFRNFVRTDCGHRAAEAEAEDGAEDRCAASGAEDETENRTYKPVFPPANSQDYSGYKFLLDQVLRREFRFLSQEHEEMICSLFNFLDKTGDSKLDINDFKGEAVPDENARMGVLWTFLQKYYDLNEDNEITRDEFMKCFILEALLKDMKPMERHMMLYDQLLYIKASFDEALGEIIEEKKTMFEKAGTNKLHKHKEEITRNRRNSLPNTFGKLKDEQKDLVKYVWEDFWVYLLPQITYQRLSILFKRLDRDENGVLEKKDFTSESQIISRDKIDEYWSRLQYIFDYDSNNQITPKEFTYTFMIRAFTKGLFYYEHTNEPGYSIGNVLMKWVEKYRDGLCKSIDEIYLEDMGHKVDEKIYSTYEKQIQSQHDWQTEMETKYQWVLKTA